MAKRKSTGWAPTTIGRAHVTLVGGGRRRVLPGLDVIELAVNRGRRYTPVSVEALARLAEDRRESDFADICEHMRECGEAN